MSKTTAEDGLTIVVIRSTKTAVTGTCVEDGLQYRFPQIPGLPVKVGDILRNVKFKDSAIRSENSRKD